jgi:hypothetical protein
MTLIFQEAREVSTTVQVSKTMGDPQHQGEGHQGAMQHQHGTTGN